MQTYDYNCAICGYADTDHSAFGFDDALAHMEWTETREAPDYPFERNEFWAVDARLRDVLLGNMIVPRAMLVAMLGEKQVREEEARFEERLAYSLNNDVSDGMPHGTLHGTFATFAAELEAA